MRSCAGALVFVCVCVLLLTVHGQVCGRLHLAGRVRRSARVHARVLGVRRLDEQHRVVALLDHLRFRGNFEEPLESLDTLKRRSLRRLT